MFYLERGSGLPVLALHGAGATGRQWGYQLRDLRGQSRIIAPDLAGHGRSGGLPPGSIADASTQLMALLDRLGVERAVVMGHSMGGAIAQWLALYTPQRVRGLILVGTGARLPIAAELVAAIEHDWPSAAMLITRQAYAPGTEPMLITRLATELALAPAGLVLADYRACAQHDLTTQLQRIAVPTLIVVGEHDRLTPPYLSSELQAAIPDSQLAVVPAAGHMVMLEKPDAFNEEVRRWLATGLEP